jgi:hypothetical protein
MRIRASSRCERACHGYKRKIPRIEEPVESRHVTMLLRLSVVSTRLNGFRLFSLSLARHPHFTAHCV